MSDGAGIANAASRAGAKDATFRAQSERRTPMPRSRLPLARLVGVLALVLAAEPARAQDFLDKLKDPTREPLLPRFTDLLGAAATTSAPATAPSPRIRLFRFQPGFLNDPVGLN